MIGTVWFRTALCLHGILGFKVRSVRRDTSRANASLSVVAFCTAFASATLTFHRDRLSLKSSKCSHSLADLLNLSLRTRRSRATLNVTLLVLKHCLFAVPDMQPDNTTKEWVRDPAPTVICQYPHSFSAVRTVQKRPLFRKPGQGQCGLATGNPIRPCTMLTKTTDTGCQQTLWRELYLLSPPLLHYLDEDGSGSLFQLRLFVPPFIWL